MGDMWSFFKKKIRKKLTDVDEVKIGKSRYLLEMQSPGLAARPGPKFEPGQAFCGTRTTSAGLMLGSGEAIIIYYALAAGLRAVLETCWLGSILGSDDFMRYRSGLELGFWKNLCTSSIYVTFEA